MLRPISYFAALFCVLTAIGCSQPVLPVKKHSATKSVVPPLAPGQVALVNAEVPFRAPQRLSREMLQPRVLVIKPIDQWTEQEVAAEAIGRIGAAAVPELRRSLASSDPHVRLQAADVLARVGSDARDAVPDLVQRLDDEDPRVRRAAARTLGRIGPEASEAVPALMRTLLQPEPLLPE